MLLRMVQDVNYETFSDIIRKLPGNEVNLKYNHTNVQLDITGGNCLFTLPTLPANEFPTLEQKLDNASKFTIIASDLAYLIEYTKFSISNEETRYNLNGIYLHKSSIEENRLAAVSTDGHRLSNNSVALPDSALEIADVILPKKTPLELLKIIKDPSCADFDVTIEVNNIKAMFSCNNITLISKLIDGKFPKYESFLPQVNKNL